jgi:RimJ/RimL family protein N-acetyltransferase
VPLSADETRNSLACIIEVFKNRGFGRWALIHKELNKLIGYCGFASGNSQVGVEIAYLLARPYWGQGLASEAAGACLRYGFEELKLDSIGGVTRPGNSKSRRVLERLGMRYVSEAIYAGYDCVYYSLPRSEFRPHPAAYFVQQL